MNSTTAVVRARVEHATVRLVGRGGFGFLLPGSEL
jgi:hypothetical protein